MRPVDLPAQLETARLIIRPYRAGDGPEYLAVCRRNREHLLPYEADNPALEVETEQGAETLVRDLRAMWDERKVFFLGAWDKQSGEWVAQVVLSVVDGRLPEYAAGYWVDRGHEGKGYVTEAAGAVLGLAFGPLGAHRVRVTCSENNVRSIAVAERLGFVREGCLREAAQTRGPGGSPDNEVIYGLLRREYESLAGTTG